MLKWDESEGKGLDDYLKSRLTEHFYHIKGDERASIQEEMWCEVGLSTDQQQTDNPPFEVASQIVEAPDRHHGVDRVISGSKEISW